MKKYLILIICSSLLFSCQPTKVKPKVENYNFSKINAYIRYLAQTREFLAEITFKTDSTIQLQGEVLVNNEAMIAKRLPMVGLQYRLRKEHTNFVNAYTFSYPEKDGRLIEWSIDMAAFSNLKVVSEGGLSQEKGGLVAWEGEPLGKDDGLILIFTDAEGSTFKINHTGLTKGKTFAIQPIYVQRLVKGTASVLITRQKTVVERTPDGKSKMIRIEYYLPAVKFEVF